MSQVKIFFKEHPASHQVFETSDGLLFHQDGDAMLHAKSLPDKTVTAHVRYVVLAAPDEDDVTGSTELPVINDLQLHGKPAEANSAQDVLTAQSLQLPVTDTVKEQLEVPAKATGEAVTDTVATTSDTPGNNHMPQTVIGAPKPKKGSKGKN